jgi:hypothetical protein
LKVKVPLLTPETNTAVRVSFFRIGVIYSNTLLASPQGGSSSTFGNHNLIGSHIGASFTGLTVIVTLTVLLSVISVIGFIGEKLSGGFEPLYITECSVTVEG